MHHYTFPTKITSDFIWASCMGSKPLQKRGVTVLLNYTGTNYLCNWTSQRRLPYSICKTSW